MKIVKINTEYITLSQLLKMTTIASSGGEAKILLFDLEVYLNGEAENRRGKKLYNGDVINIIGHGEFKISND